MEIKDIIKVLIRISTNLREHECQYFGMNSDKCKWCSLATDLDFAIWHLRGKK